MSEKSESLKETLKKQVGHVKHYIKRPIDSIGEKLKDGRAKLVSKYDKGVTKTQTNAVVDKAADVNATLGGKSEKELLNNEEGTFSKIRSGLVNGTAILTPFVIGLPIKMIDDAIKNKTDIKNAEKYDQVYEKEIVWTEHQIKEKKEQGEDTEKLEKYCSNLKKARKKTRDHINKLKEEEKEIGKKNESAKEAFEITQEPNKYGPLARFVLMREEYYNDENKYDNLLVEAWCELVYSAAKKADYTRIYRNIRNAAVTESTSEILPKIVNTDGRKSAYIITVGLITEALKSDKRLIKAYDSLIGGMNNKYAFYEGKTDELDVAEFVAEKFNGSPSLFANRMRVLMETINDKISYTGCKAYFADSEKRPVICIEGIVQSAQDKVRSGVHAVRNILPEENPIKTGERVTEPLDAAVNNIIDNVKSALASDKRDEINTGKFRIKLMRVITKCIVYGGTAVFIHPAVAAILFLGKMALDNSIDAKERKKITDDLDAELEIVEEKIKDADSKGDNENKYKLMRIRKSLKNESDRIKLHMSK